ncbi:6-phosphogluconolactonase [Pigmentiphaga aceris]|uniref:6-phosphogluconolactonase n=1 Tax=Pigmentiphaga aceris TaxID=1940612 RepID=A0A5C0B064_9BURK|nr:6-phosphogluconolactonase [Pigmentiphaga aceris]QEI07988.1 6-phosphogluconolactonase [Pigmentiphaga aceris]
MSAASAAVTSVLPDRETLATHVAEWLVDEIARSTGPFSIALSGGSTPRPLFERLAEPARAARIDWSRVHLFWGDERFVPHDHPDSNYLMARRAMIDHVPIPPGNVHPVPTHGSPEEAARDYARTLRDFYQGERINPTAPLFNVNLLGMGGDGHTASLFPGSLALSERDDWVVAVIGEKPEPRITLTLPVLASAASVVFMVEGASKQEPLARARAGDPSVPAGLVWSDGQLIWFLDEAVAGGKIDPTD